MHIYLRQSWNICWNTLKFIAIPINTTIKANKDKPLVTLVKWTFLEPEWNVLSHGLFK